MKYYPDESMAHAKLVLQTDFSTKPAPGFDPGVEMTDCVMLSGARSTRCHLSCHSEPRIESGTGSARNLYMPTISSIASHSEPVLNTVKE